MTASPGLTPTDFARYDPATGLILEVGNMSIGGIEHITATLGYSYVVGVATLAGHYVALTDPPAIAQRTPCPATIDGQVLSGLPVPCTVEVTDQTGDAFLMACDEPSLALEFEYPGSYSVTVRSVPYLDGVFSVEVP